ncbi:hypothetical protein GQ457_06G012210 [Hibiscus cannabinus]
MENNTISLRSLLEKEKLNGINFLDWFRNLRIVLKQERKEYVIEEPVPNEPGTNASRANKHKFKKHMDEILDVGCLVLVTMTPELQKQREYMVAYEMIQNLKEILKGKHKNRAKGKRKKRTKSKGNGESKPKEKDALKTEGEISKEGKCFHCDKPGHLKGNCPVYLEEVKKAKAVGVSNFVFMLLILSC